MSDQQKMSDIETLARMAARLAGRNPDEHFKMALGDVVPFDGPMWSYPDFLARADAAYHALTTPSLTVPPTKKHDRGVAGCLDMRGTTP
jgi:hypothetical protein